MIQEAVDQFYVGHGDVDAQSKPVVAAGYAPAVLYRGVTVRAAHANTGVIYVGPSTVSPTNGFPLLADEQVDVPVNDIHKVYVMAVSVGNATQTVTLSGFAAGSKFTLSYKGQTTTTLARDAAAVTVQTALRALSTIGAGNCTVTGNAGGPYTVEFVGDLAGLDAVLLTGDCVNEVQSVVVTNAIAGDTIVLTHGGTDTDPLDYDASAAEVEAALKGLASIGEGNVSVTDMSGGWAVEFVGDLADTDASAITGVGGSDEVQTINVSGGIAGATMVLSWGGDDTSALAYNVSGANLQTALEGLDGIEPGDVSVTGSGPYVVTFQGLLAKTDVAAITGVGGANETQTITVSGGVAGATMVLTVGAAGDTAALAYNVSGANLQTALEAIPAVGAGNVSVVGNGPYAISFIVALAKTDIAAITGVGGVNETQTVTVSGGVAGATMVLTLGADSTSALAYNVSGANLQTALRALASVGAGNCTVTGDGPYSVEFISGKAKTDMAAITGIGGVNETQTLTVSGGVAGATMVLTLGVDSTSALAYNVSGADLQTALRALASIGAGNCTVTGAGPYSVEFISGKAKTDMAAITGVGGVNETQTVTVSGGSGSDTIVLTLGANSTDPLAYNVSGADLQTALRALASIGAGNCTVTGDGPYSVEFISGKAKTDMAAITGTQARNEQQTVTLNGVASGTFTLTYATKTTSDIDYDATAQEVQDALEGLSNIANGDVSVTGTAPEWTVEFTGTLGNTHIEDLTGDNAELVGDPATITIAETVKGNGASVSVVESQKGANLTIGVVESQKGASLTVGVVESQKGANLTIGVVESQKGCNLTVGVVESQKGNEATVTVTETIKGDVNAAVAVASTGQASDGCDYAFIGA